MTNPFTYVGPCAAEVAICRPDATNMVLQYLRRSEYVSVLAPRQSGKSTFFNVDIYPALVDSFVVCRLDLEDAAKDALVPAFTRAWQRRESARDPEQEARDESDGAIDIKDWLGRHQTEHQVVFLVDELPRDPEVAALLLLHIMGYFNEAVERKLQRRHLFVFAGSGDLAFLTAREAPYPSVFNLAYEVYLGDLSASETRGLIVNLIRDTDRAHPFDDGAISKIFALTQGHPYLTQLLCAKLYETPDRRDEILASADQAVRLCGIEDSLNAQAMMSRLADAEGMAEERMLLLDILNGVEPRPFTPTARAHKSLQLQGCIREREGLCTLRNPIYEVVFRRFFEAERPFRARRHAEAARGEDDSALRFETRIRRFNGVLYVSISGPDGPVSPVADTEDPCFVLGWGREYRLAGALIEGQSSESGTEFESNHTAKVPIQVPGSGARDRGIEYRLSPDSFTVDFSPREITVAFPGSGQGDARPGYFEFRFFAPPKPFTEGAGGSETGPPFPLDKASGADSTDPAARTFRIFIRIFQGPALVQVCELRFHLSGS